MVKLRFVGDVHGKFDQYLRLLDGANHTLQVGDMGFEYKKIAHLDVKRHRFIEGNHDNYDRRSPLSLGDWGVHSIEGIADAFFVRGAWSIDYRLRQRAMQMGDPKCYWEQEELSYSQLSEALAAYSRLKPDLVVTHDAPLSISREITDPSFAESFGWSADVKSRTQLALQAMFESWQPQLWVFGHYHRSFHENRNTTEFVGLNELETFDIDRRLVPSTLKRKA